MTSLLRIVLPFIFIINTGFSQSDPGKLLGFLAGQANRRQVVTLVDSARSVISLEPERGREIAKQALELAYAIGDDSCAASALHEVGKGYYFENDYAGALGYWLMALNLREKIGDKPGSVATMNNIGIAFFEISKYEEALKYYFKALKIKEELGNRRSIANTLNNIGSVCNLLGDTDQALEYYNRSIAINLSYPSLNGVLITQIVPDGPAASAGMRPGDILMAVNGVRTTSIRSLGQYFDNHDLRVGDVLDLEIFRNRDSMMLYMHLVEAPQR